MANVSYDTLTIEINADSGKATRSINKLSNSLLKLEDTAKHLDWKMLEKSKKYLEDIANISFDNVRQGLQDVVSAFKALNKEAERGVKPIGAKAQAKAIDLMTNGGQGFVEPKIDFPAFDLSKIAQKTSNFIDFDTITRSVGELNEGLSTTEARLKGLGFTAEQIESMMSMGQANRDLQEKISLLQSLGLNAQQAKEALKSVNQEANEGSEGGDKSDKGGSKGMGKLQKLFNSIKRIALYRLIRRIIQIIAKAIREGIQNIAKFSKEFNQTMSNIKSALTYLKNAIGSAIAPIIQIIEPTLTKLIMMFAELFNKIGEIMSALQGKSMFIKAKYEAEDYARSLNKVSLGIDELNVLQENSGNFEEVAISDEAIETANFLRDILNDIKSIIETIKPFIMIVINTAKDFIEKILPKIKPLLNGVKEILSPIAGLLTMLIDDTGTLVNDSLASVVDMVAQIFTFVGHIVQSLMPLLVPIMKLIGAIINMINQQISNVAKFVKNIVGGLDWINYILTPISIVFGVIVNAIASLFGVISAVMQVLWDIIHGNWNEIGTHWEQAMSDISNSWSNNFVGAIQSTPLAGLGNDNGVAPSYSETQGYDDIQVNVFMDSDQVATRVEKKFRNNGVDNFYGGNLTYGK